MCSTRSAAQPGTRHRLEHSEHNPQLHMSPRGEFTKSAHCNPVGAGALPLLGGEEPEPEGRVELSDG